MLGLWRITTQCMHKTLCTQSENFALMSCKNCISLDWYTSDINRAFMQYWLFPIVPHNMCLRRYYEYIWLFCRLNNDVIKWKKFPCYWPFWGESTGGFPSQRPVTRSFDEFLYSAWATNRDAGNLRNYRAHYDVIVMWWQSNLTSWLMTRH